MLNISNNSERFQRYLSVTPGSGSLYSDDATAEKYKHIRTCVFCIL